MIAKDAGSGTRPEPIWSRNGSESDVEEEESSGLGEESDEESAYNVSRMGEEEEARLVEE